MNSRVLKSFAVVVCASINLFGADLKENKSDLDKSLAPKVILDMVQCKLNKAKTFSMTVLEEKGGVKSETKCVAKQHGKGVVSCRQEQRALLTGAMAQPFVTITDHNKLYYFPTGCGNVAVRMKYLEVRKPETPMANLFLSNGTCEMVKEEKDDYLIRYICTPNEVNELKTAFDKQMDVKINKDMIPAVMDYKISKQSPTLLEVTVYSERGKLISKQSFSDWLFDVEIPDSTFEVPKEFIQYVVKSAKDAEKLQAELLKVALAEQAKKQSQNKQPRK